MSDENRLSWNAATRAHNAHKVDQAGFLRRGGSTLFPEELDLLGDVAGKRLIHLQCNAGQDSLCLAALGAEVVGVDISDEAVDFARDLSRDAAIPARFERADVYDYLTTTDDRFDIAFSSYGFWMWLRDLDAWAAGVARILAPGGFFACVEFHPLTSLLDDDLTMTARPLPRGRYECPEGVSDYVGVSGGSLSPSGHRETEPFVNPHPSVEYDWWIEDMLNALARAGLVLETFREYPYLNGDRFRKDLIELRERKYALPNGNLPLMFGVKARR